MSPWVHASAAELAWVTQQFLHPHRRQPPLSLTETSSKMALAQSQEQGSAPIAPVSGLAQQLKRAAMGLWGYVAPQSS